MDDIIFIASVHKVQTLVDGGWRFTFDASEDSSEIGALLAECQRFGVALRFVANAIEKEEIQIKQDDTRGKQEEPRKIKY